jgi:uncharacterized protein
MAIAIFTSLAGESLEDYASRLFQTWRLGRKSLDNGVLLVVFVQDRKLRLEVGYGLEPVLTDAAAARIIREVIAPRFREGRHAAGLAQAADAVYGLVAPESAARARQGARGLRRKSADELRRESDRWRRQQRRHEDSARLYLILFLGLVAAVVGGLAWEATRQHGVTAGRRGWSRSSGWSSGGWSGGGWSSGGGGGFSGGGGSSGGGGASGSW